MNPIDFPESNKTLLPPKGKTEEEVGKLPVWTDGEICLSCWRPSFMERLSVLFFGKVWLWVWIGHTQPPVAVTASRKVGE